MKYRKKPVVIEAIQWKGDNFIEIDNFITVEHETYPSVGIFIIPTLGGIHEASLNDYIIKGVKGEFYPCKPDIFEMTYEAADSNNSITLPIIDAKEIAKAVVQTINNMNNQAARNLSRY